MNTDNIKAQMRKGMLEYCILLIIKQKRAYTNDIINELRAAELIVVEGTLYPLLTRLKNDGYLNYMWEESTQGPPRKYYELSENGFMLLTEMENIWQNMNQSIQNLKNK